MWQYLKSDFRANKASIKSLIIVVLFRISNFFSLHQNIIIRLLGIPVRIFYKLLVEFIMSVEIPDKLHIGYGLRIFHGMGLVVNDKAMLGNNVTLRQNTTIGSKYENGPCPTIEDDVDIGANTVIIGDIRIGKNSIIGAGSVLVKSYPANSIIVGNPARVIKGKK